MNWEPIFNRRTHTALAEVKRIYRQLKIKPKAKIISVVGTNGKGSVANYLAQGLSFHNYQVGVFTSPHILKANERIKINDTFISDQDVQRLIAKLPPNLHFFATMFLVAMLYFVEKKVDIIILEAGIGGKEDTTNAIKADFGVVTSIALDHQNLLGNSLATIAQEKAGIINPKMVFFIPTQLPEYVQEIFINQVIKNKNASFRMLNNLSHSYHLRNQMVAKQMLKLAFNIDFDNFKTLPGRSTIIKQGKINLIYDVGHNYAAFKATIQELAKTGIDFKQVVICLSKSKNKEGVVELFPHKKVFAFPLDQSFWSAQDLKVLPLKELKVANFKQSTLFIGSFRFIEWLWKQKK